jgi:ABC-type polysaccharide/polyol phosphate export permease
MPTLEQVCKRLFCLEIMAAMLESARSGFYGPNLALPGFLIVGYPLMSIVLFMGMAAVFTFHATFFRALEESRKAGFRST